MSLQNAAIVKVTQSVKIKNCEPIEALIYVPSFIQTHFCSLNVASSLTKCFDTMQIRLTLSLIEFAKQESDYDFEI